jgi:hypothetical protein
MKISRINEFNISKKELRNSKIEMTVRILIKYPEYDKWLKFRPKRRKRKIDSALRQNFKLLKKVFFGKKFELIGNKDKPRGVKIQLDFNELRKLKKLKFVDSVYLIDIEGIEKKKLKLENKKMFISVKARFAIQVEGIKSGKQKYEDRILIIKAKSFKSAEKKLRKEFKEYQKPYLNSDGRLVRWRLEKFIDFFETDIYRSDDFNRKSGNEIFSVLKERKLIPSLTWKEQWEK